MTRETEFDLKSCPLDGRNLIEASAGTGKTYAISRIFLRLLLEKRFEVGKILAVTFTEAATEELKRRIRSMLHESKRAFETGTAAEPLLSELLVRCDRQRALESISAALRDFDTAAIYTIHGFCQLILHENAFECNQPFNMELITDQTEMFKEIADDFWRRHFLRASSLFITYALHKKITPATMLYPLQRFAAQTNLTLTPQARVVETVQLEQAFEARRRDCRALWQNNREMILAALNTDSLDGRKYSAAACTGLYADFEAFINSASPGPHLCDHFEKLTQRFIEAAAKKSRPRVEHDFFQQCEALYDLAGQLCAAFDARLLALKSEFLSYAATELTARKEKRTVVYFDDLLSRVSNALLAGDGGRLTEAVQTRFRAALIDEFQDTDPLQYAIFSTLFPQGSILFLIGDPKQAIYSFRGADIFAYLKASTQVERRYTLSVNYRSHPRLITALNALFCNRPDAFVYNQIRYCPVSPRPADLSVADCGAAGESQLQLWILDRSSGSHTAEPLPVSTARLRIAEAVALEIAAILTGNAFPTSPAQPKDIAVLTRSNRETHLIRDALTSQGVMAVIENTDSIFAQPQAEEMYRLLSALRDPAHRDLCMAALATPFFGLNAAAIAAAATSETGAGGRITSIHEYHDLWRRHGFMRMMQTLMTREAVRARLLMQPGGDRSLTNILHLLELIHAEESRRRLTPGLVCSWLSSKVASSEVCGADEEIVRLESDENAVRVMTIHKSKGLEFPVVFCPFSWVGSGAPKNEKNGPLFFHDPRHTDAPTLALSEEEIHRGEPFAARERLAENIRLLYVALTRAKLRCYCVWGMISSAETSSLAYLLHGAADQTPAQLAAYCKVMSDQRLRADLAPLAGRSGGSIAVCTMEQRFRGRYNTNTQAAAYCSKPFNASIPRPWSISSFTSLTKNSPRQTDTDDTAARFDAAQDFGRFESWKPASSHLHGFPRGAATGLFFHAVLEHLDFANADSPENSLSIKRLLKEYGFAVAWCDPVVQMVKALSATQLPGAADPFSLSMVSPEHCMREIEFHFPLKRIEPAMVEEFIRASEPYGAKTNNPRLIFSPVHGYLKGFIDCVVDYGGRYYLIDWKSNYAGNSFDAYSRASLESIMTKHGYTLQYLLYVTALDALLSFRLPGYRYTDHFGGVAYIFLRGISPSAPNGSGIFFYTPPETVVRGLRSTLIDDRQIPLKKAGGP